jgi:hypothetical protein
MIIDLIDAGFFGTSRPALHEGRIGLRRGGQRPERRAEMIKQCHAYRRGDDPS